MNQQILNTVDLAFQTNSKNFGITKEASGHLMNNAMTWTTPSKFALHFMLHFSLSNASKCNNDKLSLFTRSTFFHCPHTNQNYLNGKV